MTVSGEATKTITDDGRLTMTSATWNYLFKRAKACIPRFVVEVADTPGVWGGMTATELRLRFFRDLTDAQRIAALVRGHLGEAAREATTHVAQGVLFRRMLERGEGQLFVDELNRVAASKNYGAPE